MIKIALCEDVEVQRLMLEDIVFEFIKERKLHAEVKSFGNGEEVLRYVEKNGYFDIYILDIIMPGMKGIDLGRRLRGLGDEGKLIFLTATPEYAVDSYQVEAFFYYLKPLSRQGIMSILDKALLSIARDHSGPAGSSAADVKIEVKTTDGKAIIALEDLDYVDIVDRRLTYHLSDETELMGPMLRSTFSQAVEFLSAHDNILLVGSYLAVNLYSVKKVDMDTVHFKNGTHIHLSKRAALDLYDRFTADSGT